jgi:hypothetical protein
MDRTVTFKQEETSGHEPHPGLDTMTDRLTDRQSQCDFDIDIDLDKIVERELDCRIGSISGGSAFRSDSTKNCKKTS